MTEPTTTTAKTKGEALFEQYLRDRGIEFEYEVSDGDGSRQPDYRLKTTPVVFCEVKDSGVGPDERAELEALERGERVGTRGPSQLYGRIRDAIGKAAKQLRAAKGTPCVVVLYNDGSSINFAPIFVGGAMFGDPVIVVPLDGGETSTAFTKGRMTGKNKNTTVSAVAVLSRTNADQKRIDQVTTEAAAAAESEDAVSAIIRAVIRLGESSPEALAQVPYLTVHHNPFAVAPLPEQVFNGPNDRHFRY